MHISRQKWIGNGLLQAMYKNNSLSECSIIGI